MQVEMELSRIIIQEHSDQQFIFLKERNGDRSFPIVIGINEAIAIDRRLKGIPTPRPMTHDLLHRVIADMGGTLERVVINDIRNHTFFAQLIIRRNGELIEVDSRPSDAIALGVLDNTPIYVAQHVLEEVL
jgi:bifunctional DNase/RNase